MTLDKSYVHLFPFDADIIGSQRCERSSVDDILSIS